MNGLILVILIITGGLWVLKELVNWLIATPSEPEIDYIPIVRYDVSQSRPGGGGFLRFLVMLLVVTLIVALIVG